MCARERQLVELPEVLHATLAVWDELDAVGWGITEQCKVSVCGAWLGGYTAGSQTWACPTMCSSRRFYPRACARGCIHADRF